MWPFRKKPPPGPDSREKWGVLFRQADEAANQIKALLTSLGGERDKSRQRDANCAALLTAVMKAIDFCHMISWSTPVVQSIRRNLAAILDQQGIKVMKVKSGQKVSDFRPSFLSITLVEGDDGKILAVMEPGYETAEGDLVRRCSVLAGRKSPLPEQTNTGSKPDNENQEKENGNGNTGH